MAQLAASGLAGGGEGVDHRFAPDRTLRDSETVTGKGWKIRAIHTPGHFGNHMCFAWNDALFTGDHIMGWASSLVSPPDGDLTAFMASTRKLAALDVKILYPGHGDPVTDPAARIEWLLAHRTGREQQILARLGATPATIGDLAAAIYSGTPAALIPAAERNVFAHLVDLAGRNLVKSTGNISFQSGFYRTSK
jgi:glyoxylase-like metal-dependent hydrolase (beta-lactamase superfamily II)